MGWFRLLLNIALLRPVSRPLLIVRIFTDRELVTQNGLQHRLLNFYLVEQETRDPLLTRAKKLIHYIAFDTAIPASQVIHETFIEPRLGLKCARLCR
jgi:hypothetical protein